MTNAHRNLQRLRTLPVGTPVGLLFSPGSLRLWPVRTTRAKTRRIAGHLTLEVKAQDGPAYVLLSAIAEVLVEKLAA